MLGLQVLKDTKHLSVRTRRGLRMPGVERRDVFIFVYSGDPQWEVVMETAGSGVAMNVGFPPRYVYCGTDIFSFFRLGYYSALVDTLTGS